MPVRQLHPKERRLAQHFDQCAFKADGVFSRHVKMSKALPLQRNGARNIGKRSGVRNRFFRAFGVRPFQAQTRFPPGKKCGLTRIRLVKSGAFVFNQGWPKRREIDCALEKPMNDHRLPAHFRFPFWLLLIAVILPAFAPRLFSQATLQLSVSGTSVTVSDNSPADENLAPGEVNFGGPLPGWPTTFVTGITKPAYGSSTNASIDVNAIASGRGLFTNMFSERHFTSASPRTLVVAVGGGTLDSSCAVTARVYRGSALFDRSQLLLELSSTETNFSATTNLLLPALTDFSLTLELIFARDPTNTSDAFFIADFQAFLPTTVKLTGTARLGTNGPPLPGVSVILATNGVSFSQTDTDANGVYRLNDVPFGHYTITPVLLDFAFTPESYVVNAQTYTNLPPFYAVPRLRLDPAGPAVNLSWPGSVTNHHLQSATALPAGWTDVTNVPSLQLDRWQVTLPANEPAQFFRLTGP
jgi:hypothetical protein